MANRIYENYADKLLGLAAAAHALVDWDAHNVKAALTDHADVTPDPATHQDYDDIDGGTVSLSANMTGAVIADGFVDVDDFDFADVTGDQAESITWFYDSGVVSTSPLLVYVDTATGLPVTPNGNDIHIVLPGTGLLRLVP